MGKRLKEIAQEAETRLSLENLFKKYFLSNK
jgi:hypothetical protein